MSPRPLPPLIHINRLKLGICGATCTFGTVKSLPSKSNANMLPCMGRGDSSAVWDLPLRKNSTSRSSPSSTPCMKSSSILLALLSLSAVSVSPFMAVMTSPALRPASSAAPPGDTPSIVTPSTGSSLSSDPIVMPSIGPWPLRIILSMVATRGKLCRDNSATCCAASANAASASRMRISTSTFSSLMSRARSACACAISLAASAISLSRSNSRRSASRIMSSISSTSSCAKAGKQSATRIAITQVFLQILI